MGEASETMFTPEGQKIQAKFNRVSDCYDHTGWGLEIVRPQQIVDGFATMQWCTLNEDTTFEQVLSADKKMNAYLDEENMPSGFARWWPGSGIPSRFDADMLWVQTNSSLSAVSYTHLTLTTKA